MNNAGTHFYDESYRRGQLFSYRRWMYAPFLNALVRKANLKRGGTVLDVGCGQGFFTQLFAESGFQTLGIDSSAEGIRLAKEHCGGSLARFEVGDALSLNCKGEYDCVFVRGLSLYNRESLEKTHEVTKVLLSYLKPCGILIFGYGTVLSPRKVSETWAHHSLSDARKYFSAYPGTKVYFSLRIETLLFGPEAFCSSLTFAAAAVSRITGIGGELVALIPQLSLPRMQSCGQKIDPQRCGSHFPAA